MVPVLTICVVTPLLVILCWKDCRYRLLPNTYTIGMAVLGLIWRFAFGGIPGLVDGLLGGLVCAGFLFIPFLMKGAGGGDLKMMFAAGIFTGFRYCCAEMLFVSIAGLLLGLVMLIAGKVNAARLKHSCTQSLTGATTANPERKIFRKRKMKRPVYRLVWQSPSVRL